MLFVSLPSISSTVSVVVQRSAQARSSPVAALRCCYQSISFRAAPGSSGVVEFRQFCTAIGQVPLSKRTDKRCCKEQTHCELQDPHRDCQLLPVVPAPQLWPGQQQGLIVLIPDVVLAMWMLVDVLRDGLRFVGRGIAEDFTNPDRSHTQSSRRRGHPLRLHPNRPDKYRFHASSGRVPTQLR